MKTLTLIFLIVLPLNLLAQSSSLLGKKIQELEFKSVLNYADTSAKLSDFNSKVVLLDFWATWCSPCITSMAHLEDLQTQFKDDLLVMTVTDEDKARIQKFLSKRKTQLPITIDTERKLNNLFPHRTIPHTVVIDKDGIVKVVSSPKEVSSEVIEKIIKGEEVTLPEKKDILKFDYSKPLALDDEFSIYHAITPYKQGVAGMSNVTGGNGEFKNRRILATNVPPTKLFEIAYQWHSTIRMEFEVKNAEKLEWNKHNAVCFDLIVPESLSEQKFEIMQKQLDIAFPYKASIEKREKVVKVLKVIEGRRFDLPDTELTEQSGSEDGQGLFMKNAQIKLVTSFLERQLRIPVVDETGLSGNYNFEIPWYNEAPEQIHEELEKLGLELLDAQREIKVFVISDK
ncbi:redoxin domain-containing protein [Flexithrix dorotheae]|uniref:redoxin domain-containing protein n=1 Tax=Flexithrix dorotheae TaxID=70993 RepID=UPI0003689438|nr:redoxin domain-containing protein [Flexithrix dorotheae]